MFSRSLYLYIQLCSVIVCSSYIRVRLDSIFPFRLFSSSLFSFIICRTVFTIIIQFNNNNTTNHCGKVQHTFCLSLLEVLNMNIGTDSRVSCIYTIWLGQCYRTVFSTVYYRVLITTHKHIDDGAQIRAKKAAFLRLFCYNLLWLQNLLSLIHFVPKRKIIRHHNLIGGFFFFEKIKFVKKQLFADKNLRELF